MAYIVLFVTKTHHNGASLAFILAPEPQVKPDLRFIRSSRVSFMKNDSVPVRGRTMLNTKFASDNPPGR